MKQKKMFRRFGRATAGFFAAVVAAVSAEAIYAQATLPASFYLPEGQSITAALPAQIRARRFEAAASAGTEGGSYTMALYTRTGAVVKEVQVQVVGRRMLVPCGTPFGIKMHTDGVIVVGMSDIETGQGLVNPAKKAGLQIGDVVSAINGIPITGNRQIGALIEQNGTKPVTIQYKRGNAVYTTTLQAARSSTDGSYKAGIWVRDSSAGIGTMTYYNAADGSFGGLGHGVCDVDTGEIMPIASGEIVGARIDSVQRGEAGLPGELQGIFVGEAFGCIERNTPQGLFGSAAVPPVYGEPMEVAGSYEVHAGKAELLTTVAGQQPQRYAIELEKVDRSSGSTKNFIVRVTDPALLSATGGIVQGMSGSPIIQDGKLVGAVTHVLVNDPTRGYGIFIENMLEAAG